MFTVPLSMLYGVEAFWVLSVMAIFMASRLD